MISMKDVKPLCYDDTIVLTVHVLDMMKKRGILYNDILLTLSSGEIIEQYEEDKPYPSCLILGYTADNRPLHIVMSIGSGVIWGITAYYPTLEKWEADYKTRKVVK